jgi:hypothetical protein
MLATSSPDDAVRRPGHTASQWLDLAEGRLRLDRLAATAVVRLSSPGLKPIPREARNSHRRHPLLRSGPTGASSIASGFPIAIEAAVVAGSKHSQGEVTWPTSVP